MPANINLLPEVRVLKAKSGQQKRLATTLTITIGLVVAGIIVGLILIIGYYAAESNTKKSEAQKLQADVDTYHNVELDADTIQEHLQSFSDLNKKRILVTEVFQQLVNALPNDITVTSFQLDSKYHASLTGTAPNYKELGIMIQALETYNVTYKPQDGLSRKPIFTNVVVSQSTKDASSGVVSYSVNFDVDNSIVKSTSKPQ